MGGWGVRASSCRPKELGMGMRRGPRGAARTEGGPRWVRRPTGQGECHVSGC